MYSTETFSRLNVPTELRYSSFYFSSIRKINIVHFLTLYRIFYNFDTRQIRNKRPSSNFPFVSSTFKIIKNTTKNSPESVISRLAK